MQAAKSKDEAKQLPSGFSGVLVSFFVFLSCPKPTF